MIELRPIINYIGDKLINLLIDQFHRDSFDR